jgi:hypothetical protein
MMRETAYGALFNVLLTLKGGAFTTVDRKLRMLEEVNPPEFPALFMRVGNQKQVARPGFPPKRTLGALIIVYALSNDAKVSSGPALNGLIDAVEAVLAPPPIQVQQTLGGIVSHAWIEGTIEVWEAIKTQRAAAMIPVNILLP